MQFSSGLSLLDRTSGALAEALAQAIDGLDGEPDVLLGFASPHHIDGAEGVASHLQAAVADGGTSLGCVAEGVIGGDEEADVGPGFAVWAARLPGAQWVSSHLEAVRTPEGIGVRGWEEPPDPVGAILLADPFSFPVAPFARQLGRMGLPVAGGLASSGRGPGGAVLMRNGRVHEHGALALALGGSIEFRTVVSQGCRPVGEPAVVTAAEGVVIEKIGGKPALVYLQELVDGLSAADRHLVHSGLHLGIVLNEYRTHFDRGDFLIRTVIDADPENGSLSIGEEIPVGRTVQFQVRDPASADEDLRQLLEGSPAAGGVLIFSCNGRGRRFFGEPHHDASVIDEMLRPPAAAGFFAAGEVGPVGGENFLHGYTASVVELRPAS